MKDSSQSYDLTKTYNAAQALDDLLYQELQGLQAKIIVLDDDPTGTQTVHDVPVYTDWSEATIQQVFDDPSQMVYLLTNSRSFSEDHTRQVHQEIAQRLAAASAAKELPFLLVSRGDSTLRGHYPLETETLRETLENIQSLQFDGEIICPAFFEGGRYTIDDIHYLQRENQVVPVGETEFAKDQSFGFQSSNLRTYITEKSHGRYQAKDCLSIPNTYLKEQQLDLIQERLQASHDFQKIIVNATNYAELKVFAAALLRTINQGKHFLFRTAASFPKVLGGIAEQPFLTKEAIVDAAAHTGGLIIIGSHVKLSTSQLDCLKASKLPLHFIEFDVAAYTKTQSFQSEINNVLHEVEAHIKQGITTAIYTSRRLLLPEGVDKEQALSAAVNVSAALTEVVARLAVKPKYVIAKGGITSSDVATKGLHIRRGMVLGQVCSGIPVWLTDKESKFPHMPYLIFPGNVGTSSTLRDIVEELER